VVVLQEGRKLAVLEAVLASSVEVAVVEAVLPSWHLQAHLALCAAPHPSPDRDTNENAHISQ
jgi:hypothetical protein